MLAFDNAKEFGFVGKISDHSVARVVFLVFEPCPFLLADMTQGYVILFLLVMFYFSSLFTIPLMIAQPLR